MTGPDDFETCEACGETVDIADYHEDASMCVDCINEIADKEHS